MGKRKKTREQRKADAGTLNAVEVKTRYIRIAPRKLRIVADAVRGMPVNEAMTMLQFVPKRGGRILLKTLKSAVAAAEVKGSLNMEALYVSRITVDKGPVLKRWLPRARGMASPIKKYLSHLTVELSDE
jgi:large subunit ribosomal protein L22